MIHITQYTSKDSGYIFSTFLLCSDRSFTIYYLTNDIAPPPQTPSNSNAPDGPGYYGAAPPRKKRFFWEGLFRPRPRVPSKTYAGTVGAAQRAVYKLRGPNGVWP